MELTPVSGDSKEGLGFNPEGLRVRGNPDIYIYMYIYVYIYIYIYIYIVTPRGALASSTHLAWPLHTIAMPNIVCVAYKRGVVWEGSYIAQ